MYDDPTQMIRQRPENEAYVKYLSHGYYPGRVGVGGRPVDLAGSVPEGDGLRALSDVRSGRRGTDERIGCEGVPLHGVESAVLVAGLRFIVVVE